jgi:hypothetical protein
LADAYCRHTSPEIAISEDSPLLCYDDAGIEFLLIHELLHLAVRSVFGVVDEWHGLKTKVVGLFVMINAQ